MMAGAAKKAAWIDCDPGLDDCFALVLAGFSPQLRLLGISTVHGNAPVSKTTQNALDFTHAAGLSYLPIVTGASKPLIRKPFPADASDPVLGEEVLSFPPAPADRKPVGAKAVAFMYQCIRQHAASTGEKVTIIALGPLTNVAVLMSVYPEIAHDLAEIIVMGGGIAGGNITPQAEFNMYVDADAASSVLASAAANAVPVTMVTLDATKQALVDRGVLQCLAWGGFDPHNPPARPPSAGASRSASPIHMRGGAGGSSTGLTSTAAWSREEIAASAVTPFRRLLLKMLCAYGAQYYGPRDPSIHDPVAVLAALDRTLFRGRRCRVDVETGSGLTMGQTVVDVDNVGGHGEAARNVDVCYAVDVDAFWRTMLVAFAAADARSPMNGPAGAAALLSATGSAAAAAAAAQAAAAAASAAGASSSHFGASASGGFPTPLPAPERVPQSPSAGTGSATGGAGAMAAMPMSPLSAAATMGASARSGFDSFSASGLGYTGASAGASGAGAAGGAGSPGSAAQLASQLANLQMQQAHMQAAQHALAAQIAAAADAAAATAASTHFYPSATAGATGIDRLGSTAGGSPGGAGTSAVGAGSQRWYSPIAAPSATSAAYVNRMAEATALLPLAANPIKAGPEALAGTRYAPSEAAFSAATSAAAAASPAASLIFGDATVSLPGDSGAPTLSAAPEGRRSPSASSVSPTAAAGAGATSSFASPAGARIAAATSSLVDEAIAAAQAALAKASTLQAVHAQLASSSAAPSAAAAAAAAAASEAEAATAAAAAAMAAASAADASAAAAAAERDAAARDAAAAAAAAADSASGASGREPIMVSSSAATSPISASSRRFGGLPLTSTLAASSSSPLVSSSAGTGLAATYMTGGRERSVSPRSRSGLGSIGGSGLGSGDLSPYRVGSPLSGTRAAAAAALLSERAAFTTKIQDSVRGLPTKYTFLHSDGSVTEFPASGPIPSPLSALGGGSTTSSSGSAATPAAAAGADAAATGAAAASNAAPAAAATGAAAAEKKDEAAAPAAAPSPGPVRRWGAGAAGSPSVASSSSAGAGSASASAPAAGGATGGVASRFGGALRSTGAGAAAGSTSAGATSSGPSWKK